MRTLTLNQLKDSNKNVKLALASMLSAMGAIITMMNISLPFPILPYLKLDFSEVPVTIAFYLLGPIYGLLTSTIYWIILTIRAGSFLGPAMKYAAVASMLLGYWMGAYLVGERKNQLVSGMIFGTLLRVFVMSIFNYQVILFVAPYYLDFIKGLLSVSGLPSSSTVEVMAWALMITGVYNLIHSILSLIPGYMITRKVAERLWIKS